MCGHRDRRKVGEVWVCLNCGMTILPNGQIFFDRKLPNINSKKGKRNGKK